MERIIAVVILSITNLLTTLGTLLVLVIVVSVSDFSSQINSYVAVEPFLIVCVFLVIEIMKWVANYFISFRKKNGWLIFHGLYLILILVIGHIFTVPFILFIVLLNIVAMYGLYLQNKLASSDIKVSTEKETETVQKQSIMDKSHLVAMFFLFLVSLYIAYHWMVMGSNLFLYPTLITNFTYIGRFIFSTIMLIFVFHSMKKIRVDRQSKWKFVFIVPLSMPIITWSVQDFSTGRLKLAFFHFLESNPLSIGTYLIVWLCYIIAIGLLAKKDKGSEAVT